MSPKIGSKWLMWGRTSNGDDYAASFTVCAVEESHIHGERNGTPCDPIPVADWQRKTASGWIEARPRVRRLTEAEEDWRRRLEAILQATPPGIGLYTVGDARLALYDLRRVKRLKDAGIHPEIADGHGLLAGLDLGSVESAVKIDGVSG